jgi:hypothetical protein
VGKILANLKLWTEMKVCIPIFRGPKKKLFTYGLCNDDVNSSDYTVLDDGMIREKRTGNNVEGSSSGLI